MKCSLFEYVISLTRANKSFVTKRCPIFNGNVFKLRKCLTSSCSIFRRYGDLRESMAFELRGEWNSLGQARTCMFGDLVAPLLELSLIPQNTLRTAIVPFFYDVMLLEFNTPMPTSPDDDADDSAAEARSIQSWRAAAPDGETTPTERCRATDSVERPQPRIKANFERFEAEMIGQIDRLFGNGAFAYCAVQLICI